MEVISNLWRDWPWPIRILMDIVILMVLIRGVLANEILETLKKHGILTDGILKPIMSWLERKATLWKHFAEGHGTALVTCSDNRCDTL